MGKVRSGLDVFWREIKTASKASGSGSSATKRPSIPASAILFPFCMPVKSKSRHFLRRNMGLPVPPRTKFPSFKSMSPVSQYPVYSLYGDQRVPTADQLTNVDVLICDLQDVGSRYYTFVWTMALAMQACAKFKKKCIVLDRPNPIGGAVLEGPTLDPNLASFVGLYPVPVRHGLTIGEMALWINGHLGVGADLDVVRMKGWPGVHVL